MNIEKTTHIWLTCRRDLLLDRRCLQPLTAVGSNLIIASIGESDIQNELTSFFEDAAVFQ